MLQGYLLLYISYNNIMNDREKSSYKILEDVRLGAIVSFPLILISIMMGLISYDYDGVNNLPVYIFSEFLFISALCLIGIMTLVELNNLREDKNWKSKYKQYEGMMIASAVSFFISAFMTLILSGYFMLQKRLCGVYAM